MFAGSSRTRELECRKGLVIKWSPLNIITLVRQKSPIQHTNAWFDPKMAYPPCISCHCHFQTTQKKLYESKLKLPSQVVAVLIGTRVCNVAWLPHHCNVFLGKIKNCWYDPTRASLLVASRAVVSCAQRSFRHSKSITMTSQWAWWRLRSPASRLFTQPFIRAQIKENIKAPRYWPLCGQFTGDRWILRTNGQ